MKAVAGFLFVVVLGALAFELIGWQGYTGAVVGGLVWLMLLVWKNWGLGNPVNQAIASLMVQNDYAREDIEELTEKRAPGYQSEVRYLEKKIRERDQEIKALEADK